MRILSEHDPNRRSLWHEKSQPCGDRNKIWVDRNKILGGRNKILNGRNILWRGRNEILISIYLTYENRNPVGLKSRNLWQGRKAVLADRRGCWARMENSDQWIVKRIVRRGTEEKRHTSCKLARAEVASSEMWVANRWDSLGKGFHAEAAETQRKWLNEVGCTSWKVALVEITNGEFSTDREKQTTKRVH